MQRVTLKLCDGYIVAFFRTMPFEVASFSPWTTQKSAEKLFLRVHDQKHAKNFYFKLPIRTRLLSINEGERHESYLDFGAGNRIAELRQKITRKQVNEAARRFAAGAFVDVAAKTRILFVRQLFVKVFC